MGVVNPESLLKPVSPEIPCGENLRWDRRFLELERLSEGTEETQFRPAEEPNWREVRDVCVELLARGKHLKVAVLISLAAVRLEGYPGLRDGLKLLQGLLEQYWDGVFPQLDADDNNDPAERVNAFAPIVTPVATFGDKLKFQERVQEAPLCESRQLGKYSLRDIAIAAGTLEVPEVEGKQKPTLGVIDAAFIETEAEFLDETAKAAEESLASVQAMEALFTTKCGEGKGPDFSGFKTILKDAALQIRRRLTARQGGSAAPAGGDASGQSVGQSGGGAALSGDVNSADDVRMALSKIIRYYEEREPSSPVPLVAKCAEQLVGKGFQDIVKILTPESVSMLERISSGQS